MAFTHANDDGGGGGGASQPVSVPTAGKPQDKKVGLGKRVIVREVLVLHVQGSKW